MHPFTTAALEARRRAPSNHPLVTVLALFAFAASGCTSDLGASSFDGADAGGGADGADGASSCGASCASAADASAEDASAEAPLSSPELPSALWVLEGSEAHGDFHLTGEAPITVSVVGTSGEELLPAAGIDVRCIDEAGGCRGHLVVTPAPGATGRGTIELDVTSGAGMRRIEIAVTVETTGPVSAPRYVAADADGSGDGSASAPWTMAQANARAAAGDTVLIGPGRYQTGLAPRQNGTADSPIRFVAAHRRRAIVDDDGSEDALLDLGARRHIQVVGLRFEVRDRAALSIFEGAEAIVLEDCTLLGQGVLRSAAIRIRNSRDVRLLNTRMERSFHNLLMISDTADVRLEGVVIGRGGHAPMFVGEGVTNMIIRGSTFLAGWGRAAGISYGPDKLLFERNVVSGAIDGHRSAGAEMKFTGDGAIYRYNRLHDNGPGAFTLRDSGRNRVLDHMRLYGNVVHGNAGQAFWVDSAGGGIFRDIAFQNNVFLDNDANGARYHFRGARVDGQVRMTSNLFHQTGGEAPNPTAVVGCPDDGNLFEDPGYVHPDRHSYLTLESGSALPEGGTPLTETTSAGTGQTIVVGDAWWAFDGFSLPGETPDLIQVGSERARIVTADGRAGVLMVDRVLTWEAGAPVSLAWEGAAPGIGCFEEGEGLEHLGIVSSAGTARSGELVRFALSGVPTDAKIVWHLGDGTRATGPVVEHAFDSGEGRFGVRAYVYGGESWQRAATSLLLSDAIAGGPAAFLEFDLDDDVAKIQTDSWNRPMANVRRVDAPHGTAVRIEGSTSDGGLQARFSPAGGWDIGAAPIMTISYRIDRGIALEVKLVAYSNTNNVRTRSLRVGGSAGAGVRLEADGLWHEARFNADVVRDALPDVTHLVGVSFNGPMGQGARRGYELDWICISADGTCE